MPTAVASATSKPSGVVPSASYMSSGGCVSWAAITSCLLLTMEEGSFAASDGTSLTPAATAIAAVFSWLIEEAAEAALAVAVDDADELGADDDGALADDEEELEQAVAPAARATARMPVTLIVMRRRFTMGEVFIIEPLPCLFYGT